MNKPRVAVIGARRSRQGLGPYAARDLAAAGADVVAIAGTRTETVDEAAQHLREQFGLAVRGYCDIPTMFASEELDAVAICSPEAKHREHLQQALDARVHVLCEKPFVFDPGRDNAADAEQIVAGFAAANRIVMVNEQWPMTLAGFAACHPNCDLDHLTRLEMLLCPSDTGPEMIPNALPHVGSMLFALAPTGGEVRDVSIRWGTSQAAELPQSEMDLRFVYAFQNREAEVTAAFRTVPDQPRPAGYAINGYAVQRLIDLTDYSMSLLPRPGQSTQSATAWMLSPQAREALIGSSIAISVKDPLSMLVNQFIRRLSDPADFVGIDTAIVDNVRLVDLLYAAAKQSS